MALLRFFPNVVLAALLGANLVQAELYPTRPVRMIVPLAAAGGMDTVARAVALKLTEHLGHTSSFRSDAPSPSRNLSPSRSHAPTNHPGFRLSDQGDIV